MLSWREPACFWSFISLERGEGDRGDRGDSKESWKLRSLSLWKIGEVPFLRPSAEARLVSFVNAIRYELRRTDRIWETGNLLLHSDWGSPSPYREAVLLQHDGRHHPPAREVLLLQHDGRHHPPAREVLCDFEDVWDFEGF